MENRYFQKKAARMASEKLENVYFEKKSRLLKKYGPTAWRFSRDILKKRYVDFFSAHSRRIDVIADFNISCHRSALTTIPKLIHFSNSEHFWTKVNSFFKIVNTSGPKLIHFLK